MILMRILPGVLKELSKHVPTVLFQTVEWSELASELPKISRRIISKDGYEDLYQQNKTLLDPYNIILTNAPLTRASIQKDKWAGEKWLTIYFAQIFSPHGLFIDLRSIHFHDERPALMWHPTGFWTKFNEDFRLGLIKVYEGFYLDNDALYFEGLEEIGLLKEEFSPEDKEELAHLFRKHFGAGISQEFKLDHFKESIIRMSEFMLNKKVKISKDFLYLGIYLVTLYSSLEETGAELPVKQIYLDVKARFTSDEPR